MSKNSRIAYLDGLKGFCVMLVALLHYIMAFVVDSGFVGWESGIANEDKISHFWANAPISFIANASFVLHIFFAIIAFLPAWHFFHKKDAEWIKKQAIVRYFRFVPYVFIFTLISYVIYVNGGYFNKELGSVINLSWPAALMNGEFSLGDATISGLFRIFWQGDGVYIPVLWCMHIIFLGSYISYALLLFFGSSKNHLYIYAILLVILCITLTWAVPFIIGIMVASIAYNELNKPSSNKVRACVGWSLLMLGLFLGLTQDGLTTNGFLQDICKNIGALCVLLSIFYLDWMQKLFQNKFLLSCGKYVFSLIIVHCIIMLSVSSWMFIKIHALYGYNMALWLTFLVAIPLNAIVTVISAKIIDPICANLSRNAYNLFK